MNKLLLLLLVLILTNALSAQWQQTSAIDGAKITALVKKDTSILAATFKNGIYSTNLTANKWKSLTPENFSPENWYFLFFNADTLFGGTSTGLFLCLEGG